MVQGINQTNALQSLQYSHMGKNLNFGTSIPASQPDSFAGKTLLTFAGIAGAVVFRKNIASFMGKNFPNVTKFISTNFAKISNSIKKFCANNSIAGGVANYFNKGTNFVKGLFGKVAALFKPQTMAKATGDVATVAKDVATKAKDVAAVATDKVATTIKPLVNPKPLAEAAKMATTPTPLPQVMEKAADVAKKVTQ